MLNDVQIKEIIEKCGQGLSAPNGECSTSEDFARKFIETVPAQYRQAEVGDTSNMVSLLCGYLSEMGDLLPTFCKVCLDIETAECECLCGIGFEMGFFCCQVQAKGDYIETVIALPDCNRASIQYKTYAPIGELLDYNFDPCDEGCYMADLCETWCLNFERPLSLYRLFLKAWAIKRTSSGRLDETLLATSLVFQSEAKYVYQESANLYINIGRKFTSKEKRLITLFRRVIPYAKGVQLHLVEEL